ncbi:hypothetical protein [Helicobacter zhangjianzhongii]|uniref:Uncharacterized protein n=1 Tax=Helicobacter zhangjianzhongii TaxID=2974574 RepID=A0ACC6FRJ9_9HELI|nr:MULTISPECIES: hypothetical protein [unclassified Helicobacter]MDL0079974.1 hypothetical protein [Helicobacter sp. CPD2-1]MDL0081762.1 hypothetical protein [Helicobacter sp. XJK30-2]
MCLIATSRAKTPKTRLIAKSQAAGFADDFGGFQGGGEGIYLSGNEQAPAAESAKSAAKPTPKPNKAKSQKTNQKSKQ